MKKKKRHSRVSGKRKAGPAALILPCCALIFLHTADVHEKKKLGHSRVG